MSESPSSRSPAYRIVLASASPGRLATLRRAGVQPEVVVSHVDEERVPVSTPETLVATLARMKCREVAGRLDGDRTTVVIGGDSMLELDGEAHGKPGTVDAATARWKAMRGRTGVLHSGHCVRLLDPTSSRVREAAGVASTVIHFGSPSDAEIRAYVATGEPLHVAGAFTIDGLGGPFVRGIEGDPHNVVGLSLPLLRELLGELSVAWPDLWGRTT
ncbi:MAG TPA: Maf family protein [Nocardioidaceae bacterium]|nr:Maf family protein [Nocardioidaceae bacterium]